MIERERNLFPLFKLKAAVLCQSINDNMSEPRSPMAYISLSVGRIIV